MLINNKFNNKVINSFTNVKLNLLFLPSLLLIIILFILFKQNAFSIEAYVDVQKELFFYLNKSLAALPDLQYNLTQLGDALILFPLFAAFIIYAPRFWGALLMSSVITLIVSYLLKKFFAVPRPAAMFDNDSFVIIGKALTGHTSLPSGHSITTFTIITLLLFVFMPKKNILKIVWSIFIVFLGFVIVFSRVGVGAHYPLDVVFGSIIGYVCALVGILISNNLNWCNWVKNKKYYPILMLLVVIWMFLIGQKIYENSLLIFYISFFSLLTTFFLMLKIYAKKEY